MLLLIVRLSSIKSCPILDTYIYVNVENKKIFLHENHAYHEIRYQGRNNQKEAFD